MQAIAKLRGIKGSPQKARLVIDLIRGRNVSQALAILKFTNKRAAQPIAKCLNSAIANATYKAEQQNIAIDPDDLWIKTCFVDMGPHKNRRRLRPAPQGRAYREQRHYCHITIEVSSEDSPEKQKKAPKPKTAKFEKKDKEAKTSVKSEQIDDTSAFVEEETKVEAQETQAAETENQETEVAEEVSVENNEGATEAEVQQSAEDQSESAEKTDVTSEVPGEVGGKETAIGETDTPFENKPLAAQTDEEETGSKMAADAKVDKVEELERQ